MDDADYLAIRRQLDAHVDTVVRLRAQWSVLPEPTRWSDSAHVAALGALRQGTEKLSRLATQLDLVIDECDLRIEQARTEAERQHSPLLPW